MHSLTYYVRLRNVLVAAVFLSAVHLWFVVFIVQHLSHVVPKTGPDEKLDALPVSDVSLTKAQAHPWQPFFVPKSLQKIDWHDYEQIKFDSKKEGVGEQGKPANLSESEAEAAEMVFKANGFNGFLSDKISLTRALPDIRHPECARKMYLESLPTVSVVVPFHNEHWSTLLRTAASVLYRSPPHLIKEVILVDDGSNKPFLKNKLDNYIAKNLSKVVVVRLKERSGLISARLVGAKQASGDVLVFLDSHTEPNVNWLPPLLEPIANDYQTVVCPFIDVIDYDTFAYTAQDEGARGAFDWGFDYKRLPILPNDEANMPEPFESPVMAGGLFAISRAFFWQLGGYDPGLDIWGGEQYELSFKIWQCHGRMVDAPCSRVGHIYRGPAVFPDPGHGQFLSKNYRRVAEVWMDEYAQYLYARNTDLLEVDPGDISEQKALRTRLQCKPFRWFMTQIAFDLTSHYPLIEPKPMAEGRVQFVAVPLVGPVNLIVALPTFSGNIGIRPDTALELCVVPDKILQLQDCGGSEETQIWRLTGFQDVRLKSSDDCWDYADLRQKNKNISESRMPISVLGCHTGGGNQMWRYYPDTKAFKFMDGDGCLDWDTKSRAIFLSACQGKDTQRWLIDTVNLEALDKWGVTSPRVTGPVETWEPSTAAV